MRNATKHLKRLRAPWGMYQDGLRVCGFAKTVRFARPALALSIVLVVGGLTGCGGGGSNSAAPQPQTTSLGSLVDSLANATMKQQGIPGMTVALAKNGSMLYAQAYGDSDMATHLATQTSTIFEIGSVTKQFTAALVMRLQEQGQLHVDDPISAYLPEYKFSSAITLRMLLTHTSGLANYTTFTQYPGWAANGVSEQTVLSAVSQTPLLFPPGTQWSYSNSNYFALGAIIEKLTGQSYAASLSQSIFQPLGLTSTYYSVPPPAQPRSVTHSMEPV
jgi:D-alanyl-D-alanine carboxypeptidase